MDIIETLIVIAFAFWLGWHARGIMIMAAIARDPDNAIKILEKIKEINAEELPKELDRNSVTIVRSEMVNGQWYLYTDHENEFLAQGSSLEQALKIASQRFPERAFWCPTDNKERQTA
jgi:hypothetical protein